MESSWLVDLIEILGGGIIQNGANFVKFKFRQPSSVWIFTFDKLALLAAQEKLNLFRE